uniref:Domain of unknown function DB domain-containing protein n=1 Tax=Panagrolaimus davidi TaxID=227884 RepID=A0A914QTI3_9BILA
MFKYLCFLALLTFVFADPNEDYAACCTEKGVPEACSKYCTYDDPARVLKLFAYKPRDGDDECKNQEVGEKLIQCAQKGKDNRECCKAAGVGNDFDYCLDFCDGTKPVDLNDEKYNNCLTGSNQVNVKKCGKDS